MLKSVLFRLPANGLAVATLLALGACGQEPQTSPEEEAAEVAKIRELASPTGAAPVDIAAPQPNDRSPDAGATAAQVPKAAGKRNPDRMTNQVAPLRPAPSPTTMTTPDPPVDDAHMDPHAGHDMQSMADHDMSEK